MQLLNVKDLYFKINNNNIIKNINFTLNTGEILTILGPSGSGKSTILKLLAGFLKPSQGEIKLRNKLLSSEKLVVSTGKRNIGLMFQEEVLFPHLTIYKNIAFGIENLKLKNKETIIKKYLQKFGLLDVQNDYPEILSGGEKQRVSLARVLITKPKILLMDEPFSSLDKNLRTVISDYTIKVLKKKKISVVFVTHDVKEALRISNRILILKNGEIEQIDTPENIYRSPNSIYTASLLTEVNRFEVVPNKLGFIITPFGKIKCKENKFFNYYDCSKIKHCCLIRPSDLFFSENGINAKIVEKHFLGPAWEYSVFIRKDFPILKLYSASKHYSIEAKVKVNIDLNKVLIYRG